MRWKNIKSNSLIFSRWIPLKFVNVPLALRYYTQRCACLGHFSPFLGVIIFKTKRHDAAITPMETWIWLVLSLKMPFCLDIFLESNDFPRKPRSSGLSQWMINIPSNCDVFETIWGFARLSLSQRKNRMMFCVSSRPKKDLWTNPQQMCSQCIPIPTRSIVMWLFCTQTETQIIRNHEKSAEMTKVRICDK